MNSGDNYIGEYATSKVHEAFAPKKVNENQVQQLQLKKPKGLNPVDQLG